MRLEQITPSLINAAIEIYLAHAYEDESLRQARMVRFSPHESIRAALARFEREDTRFASYSLRLGCQHYPHMKLALWEAYFDGEYVFAVDRHDGFDFSRAEPDYESWLGIKSRNFRAKTQVEVAGHAKGVPTIRSLKEEKLSQSDLLREFSGHSVLLVDNDADAGAIMQMILLREGYGCLWAAGVADARAVLDDPKRRGQCGVALVDLMLSDGSGVDVVKAIRARAETQEMPILMTSAMNGSDVLLTDVDGYLRKPYSAGDLVKAVADLIRRKYDGHQRRLEASRSAGSARKNTI